MFAVHVGEFAEKMPRNKELQRRIVRRSLSSRAFATPSNLQGLQNNGTAKEDGRVKFHPVPSDHGDPFPIPTIKHCKLSLSKLGENKQFTSFGEFILCRQVPIGGLRGPIYIVSPPSPELFCVAAGDASGTAVQY